MSRLTDRQLALAAEKSRYFRQELDGRLNRQAELRDRLWFARFLADASPGEMQQAEELAAAYQEPQDIEDNLIAIEEVAGALVTMLAYQVLIRRQQAAGRTA